MESMGPCLDLPLLFMLICTVVISGKYYTCSLLTFGMFEGCQLMDSFDYFLCSSVIQRYCKNLRES